MKKKVVALFYCYAVTLKIDKCRLGIQNEWFVLQTFAEINLFKNLH
jgi:hypothetical protein